MTSARTVLKKIDHAKLGMIIFRGSVNRPDPLRNFQTSIGGVGVFIPRDKFIRIVLFRNVNKRFVASE